MLGCKQLRAEPAKAMAATTRQARAKIHSLHVQLLTRARVDYSLTGRACAETVYSLFEGVLRIDGRLGMTSS